MHLILACSGIGNLGQPLTLADFMTTPPSPDVSRRRTLPFVWIVPIVALVVGGWLVLRELRSRGPEIVITFENGSGLEAGKTVLEYQGVAVGEVKKVELNAELTGVRVTVRLAKSAARLAVEGSRFWIVQPKIGFSGISGLETLLTGVRLGVRPGQGAPASQFTGLKSSPSAESVPGSTYILHANGMGSLDPGTSIYYREVKVGLVEAARLADDATEVLVRIRVHAPYNALVKPGTKFWNSSGVNMRVGLLGARIQTTSLESLVSGGLTFATPDAEAALPPAAEGTHFAIHRESEKAWLEWRPRVPLSPAPDW